MIPGAHIRMERYYRRQEFRDRQRVLGWLGLAQAVFFAASSFVLFACIAIILLNASRIELWRFRRSGIWVWETRRSRNRRGLP